MTEREFFRILNTDVFGDGVLMYSKPEFADKQYFFRAVPFRYINTFEKEGMKH